MSDYPWLRPDFAPASTAVTVVLGLLWCVLMPLTGRRAYRSLVARRNAGVPTALVHRYRGMLLRQWLTVGVVLAVVGLDGGIDRSDIGLARPDGSVARFAVAYSVVLSALIVVSGLVMRRRALRGGSVPGQRLFRAILPRTARERRVSVFVAIGAGVSEELLFRGLFIAAGVYLLGLSVFWSAVAVSAVFGLCHAYQGWRGVLGTAAIGVLMSYLYLGSHSLLPAMLLHVVIDLRAFVMVPIAAEAPDGRRRRDVPDEPGRPAVPAAGPVLAPGAVPASGSHDVDDVRDRPPVLP